MREGIADLVDFEMSSSRAGMAAVRDASRRHGVGLVCSFHDFERTPPLAELSAQFRRAEQLGGDVAKVSVMARDPEDALTLLAATQQASREVALALIGVSMGPHGALSRIAGFAFGSALTLVSPRPGPRRGRCRSGELRAAIELLRR